MSKPPLSVAQLLNAGFNEVGCWELNTESKLNCSVKLPALAGVYAFAVDGVVQYVGLASKSIRQRFGFYRTPGATQPTNIRLNEIIRGHVARGAIVEILVAHPPDGEWNGLLLRGAEGLEAGLIAQFNLPWNVRGTTPKIADRNHLDRNDKVALPRESLNSSIDAPE